MCAGEQIADQYTALHVRACWQSVQNISSVFETMRAALHLLSSMQVMQKKYTRFKVHPKDEQKICIHTTFQKPLGSRQQMLIIVCQKIQLGQSYFYIMRKVWYHQI